MKNFVRCHAYSAQDECKPRQYITHAVYVLNMKRYVFSKYEKVEITTIRQVELSAILKVNLKVYNPIR